MRNKYPSDSKEKKKEYQKRWRLNAPKTPWVNHFYAAKDRCTRKYDIYFKKGITFNMTKDDFKELWHRDNACLLKRPSIDRINNDLGYIKSNCQFIELADNIRKANTGSLHVNAKLNEYKVHEIKIRYKQGNTSYKKLGIEYGVGTTTIMKIVTEKTWRHVT